MITVQIASHLDMVNMLVIEEFNEAWNSLHFAKNNNFEYTVNYNKIVGLDFDNWEFIVEFENVTYKYRYFKDNCISYRHFPLDLIYNKAVDDWRVDLYSFVKSFVIDNRYNLNQIFSDGGKAIFEKWPDIKDEINKLNNKELENITMAVTDKNVVYMT